MNMAISTIQLRNGWKLGTVHVGTERVSQPPIKMDIKIMKGEFVHCKEEEVPQELDDLGFLMGLMDVPADILAQL